MYIVYSIYPISLKRHQIFKWSGKDTTVLNLETNQREFSSRRTIKKQREEKQEEILTVEFQAVILRQEEPSKDDNVPTQRNILLISL